MRKKITLLVLVALLLSLAAAPATARPNYNVDVYVNGELIFLPDQRAFIDTKANRTYVPLRFVAEALGAKVSWDAAKNTAAISREGKAVIVVIGAATARVDGKAVSLDAPARLANQRTMVPLRFVSQALGEKVKWEPADGSGRVLIGEGKPSGKPTDVVKLEKIHGVKLEQRPGFSDYFDYSPPKEETLVNNDRSYLRLTYDNYDKGRSVRTSVAHASILGNILDVGDVAKSDLWSHYYTGKSGPVKVDLSPIRKSLEGFFPNHPKNPVVMARAEKIAAEYMASGRFKQGSAFCDMGNGWWVSLQSGNLDFVSLTILYPEWTRSVDKRELSKDTPWI